MVIYKETFKMRNTLKISLYQVFSSQVTVALSELLTIQAGFIF